MKIDKLKRDPLPCPFCGGTEIGLYNTPYFVGGLKIGFLNAVMCERCHAAILDNEPKHCLNDVIDAWNRRTE